jgi:hypothetical protein
MKHEHPNKQRMEAIRAALNAHPGSVAYRRWDTLRRSLTALYGNLGELGGLLAAPATDFLLAAQLAGNMHPDVQRRSTDEIDRRLLNFGSSAYALVDISRRIVGGYEGTVFFDEYERRRLPLSYDAPRFLRDLRNFLQHYSVAPLRYQIELPTGQPPHRFNLDLDRDALLRWDGWSGSVSRYLETGPEGVPIPEHIADYEAKVRALYDWVMAQFEVLHAEDIDAANVLVTDYNRALTGREDWEREDFGRVRPEDASHRGDQG